MTRLTPKIIALVAIAIVLVSADDTLVASPPADLNPMLIDTDIGAYKQALFKYLTGNSWACGSAYGAFDSECATPLARGLADSCPYGVAAFSTAGYFWPRAMKAQPVIYTWGIYMDEQMKQMRTVAYIGERGNFWTLSAFNIDTGRIKFTLDYTSDTLVCEIYGIKSVNE